MLNNPQATYIQRGESLDYKNGGATDIQVNDVIVMNTRIGVADCDIPIGLTGSVTVIGVFELPASNAEAFTVGQAVYWKDTQLTGTSTGAVQAGWVVEAKVQSATKAKIKIG